MKPLRDRSTGQGPAQFKGVKRKDVDARQSSTQIKRCRRLRNNHIHPVRGIALIAVARQGLDHAGLRTALGAQELPLSVLGWRRTWEFGCVAAGREGLNMMEGSCAVDDNFCLCLWCVSDKNSFKSETFTQGFKE